MNPFEPEVSIPHSPTSERAVLGCCLGHPEVMDDVVSVLRPGDFFDPAHQDVFEALCDLYNTRTPIDSVNVHERLVKKKVAKAIGSPGILAELLTAYASHLHVGSYMSVVHEKSVLRRLSSACSKIVEYSALGSSSAAEALDMAERTIMEVGQTGLSREPSRLGLKISEITKSIMEYDSTRPITGIPSGLRSLDRLTTGWHPGQMIVLAGRPGMGKSALGLLFASTACHSQWNEEAQTFVEPGIPVGFMSLEMTEDQVGQRRLAMKSGIALDQIRRKTVLDKAGLQNAESLLREMPLFVDDESGCTVTRLRAKARRLVKKHGLKMLVIDYLQLVKSDSKKAEANRQIEVSEVSVGIKNLAKELHIPIIVLAQLNRASEGTNTEPRLHNLRESGSIEQDADIVLLLHRPDPEKKGEYRLLLEKHRDGATDQLNIKYKPEITLFSDL